MLLKAISETASLTQLRVKGPMLSSGRQEYEQRTRICLLVPVTLYSMQGFEKKHFLDYCDKKQRNNACQ